MKIKILDSSLANPKGLKFAEEINKHLKKGWKIKGNVFKGKDCLNVVLYKGRV